MKLLKNNSGQGLTEYIILMMLICVVSIATVASLGKTVRSKISEARGKIDAVSSDPDKSYDGGTGSNGSSASGQLSSLGSTLGGN